MNDQDAGKSAGSAKNFLDDASGDLQAEIERIRSHRAAWKTQELETLNAYHAGWNAVLAHARTLHDQTSDLPEVRYFVISRDESQVAIKLAGIRRNMGRSLTFYKAHPDGRFTGKHQYWLREPGHPDAHFNAPEDVVRAMTRAIAERVTASSV